MDKGERANPDLAGRPIVVHGNTQLLFPQILRPNRPVADTAIVSGRATATGLLAPFSLPCRRSVRL
jgi:hypothetical protein